VGSKKQRSAPQDEGSVAAAFRRVGEEQIREVASGAGEAEHDIRQTFGDRAGDLLRALPPEDRKSAADELLQRIKDGRTEPDDIFFWLSMRARRTRQRLEQAANAAAVVKAERSRGGKASSAARREPWQQWQRWCASQPRGLRAFRHDLVSVIQKRALGQPDEELERKRHVPPNLPVIRGRGGKPPSEKSIRRRLFGAK
jgi:hypothetical protein